MKKLLGSTLALAMFLPAGANAELLKNLKVGGQLDVQATSAQNVTDFLSGITGPNSTPGPNQSGQDHIGGAFTRVMLKADWDLLDDVHARISMVKGSNTNASARPYGGGNENLNTIQTNTIVTEANVKIDKLFGALDTTIGRQYYGNPGDMVVYYGPRDNWGLGVTALDAFRFDWNGEKVGLTGVAGKIDSAATLAANQASVDLRGLVANVKANDNLSGAAYVYNKETHATNLAAGAAASGKNDFLWVVGAKAKANIAGLTVGGEIAKNLGQNRPTGGSVNSAAYSGWAMMLNAAYKLDLNNVGALTPWGEFAYGSGRSRATSNHNDGWTDIASDYRPGGIYGRFAGDGALSTVGSGLGGTAISQSGLSNRTIYGFGVKATPASIAKLTVGAQYYHYAFSRTSTFTLPANVGGQLPRSIGTEYDVTAEWKHSENVSLKLTLGDFQPGAYVYAMRQANAAVSPATMASLDTSVRF